MDLRVLLQRHLAVEGAENLKPPGQQIPHFEAIAPLAVGRVLLKPFEATFDPRAEIRWYVGGDYLPLALATHTIQWKLWKIDTFNYHLTNVLVHSLNAALLIALLALPILSASAEELASEDEKILYALGMAVSQNLGQLGLSAEELANVIAGGPA